MPLWLTERDHPWVSALIETYLAFVGQPRRRLDEHLATIAIPDASVATGRKLATQVLDTVFRTELVAGVPPTRARTAVFQASAPGGPRDDILARVARDLCVPVPVLESSLFADLPSERILRAPEERVPTATVALLCNLAIAQAALKSSSRIAVALEGNARAFVRHARLRGLICTVSKVDDSERVTLEISGPLALFRRTVLYGRHLAELVPLLGWCKSFRLEAHCLFRGREGRLALNTGDPLPPAAEPRRYDSLLEMQFARDFTREAKDWELLREPEPVAADGTLVFPDFAIIHRRDRSLRWLLEIVGFWTTDYIERKLRWLRAANLRRLVLCIDASRDCGEDQLPRDCPVLRFRKRIDPREVLKLIQPSDTRGGP